MIVRILSLKDRQGLMDINFTVAYLDPGTGSLIMQAVLGGIAGIAVFFRAGRQRFLGRKAQTAPKIEDETTVASDE